MNLPAADVVVVGGGVIGTSIAYQLAKRNMKVALVDRVGIAGGTSGSASITVLTQTKTPGAKLGFARESIAMYPSLAEEFGRDIDFDNDGGMIVAETPAEVEYLLGKVADLQAHGLEIYYLDGQQARERQPALAGHILGSTWCPSDSVANPIYLSLAFSEAAARLGAHLHLYTDVQGLRVCKGWITAVVTSGGDIQTGAVVNACGAWAPELARMVGVDLPIVPRRGQLFVTEPAPPLLKGSVLAARYLMSKKMPTGDGASSDSMPAGIVSAQTRRGNLVVGSTREFVGYNQHVNYEGLSKLMRDMVYLVPATRHLHVIRTFAGLRPAAPDGLPIIERSKAVPNFYIAAGHEGDGIALSPITGLRVAQLIVGEIEEQVLAPFASSRFQQDL
jgi:glycine/D-amino acid oxidase-like deaminating enzyme